MSGSGYYGKYKSLKVYYAYLFLLQRRAVSWFAKSRRSSFTGEPSFSAVLATQMGHRCSVVMVSLAMLTGLQDREKLEWGIAAAMENQPAR
jgi:hypothetical protein